MRRAIATCLAIALAAAACTSEGSSLTTERDNPLPLGGTELPDDLVLAASLVPFDECDDLLDHVKARALELVTPWGLGGPGGFDGVDDMVGMEEDADAAPEGERAIEGEDFSGTNVQEAGVDEPDNVKTDGTHLYVVAQGRLMVLDVTGDEPTEVAAIDLRDAWDAQLLLDGDTLLITSGSGVAIPFAGERVADLPLPGGRGSSGWGSTSTLSLVDVSDPSDPQVTERLTLDGWVLSSRLVDGVARVVVRTEQGTNLPWTYPVASGLRAERSALDANRELIRASEVADWLPYAVHQTATGRESEGTLLACNRIARPADFAGLGILSVLTVDLGAGGLRPGSEAVGVLAGGDTVYASAERLYVATTRYVDWDDLDDQARERRARDVTTEIHAFDTSDPRRTEHLGSGEVPGTLLSQWALSEHEGVLRVASTVGDPWWDGGGPSESVVTVLELRDGALAQIGQVDGLGVTERIYAVRFIGDVGYVVTFRETDPLYTLDLADSSDPRVTGELKILGYSAYLHPMGDGLLLGVGQDADEDGGLKGTQLSLFDVSDPADPQRIDQITLGQGGSDVEYDHRAFLHWPVTGLTVVPYTRWGWDEDTQVEDVDTGAYAFTADRADGLVRRGVLTHRTLIGSPRGDGPELTDDMLWDWGWQAQIRRSVVVGERLFTISDFGVVAHDLDTLDELGGLVF